MLAQNFKTPADLGIADADFDALAKVLGMLERQEIEDLPKGPRTFSLAPLNVDLSKFYMGMVTVGTDCGTAGCILGWARHVARNRIFPETCGPTYRSTPLGRLFFGDGIFANGAQAAIALRNYLTHGEPRWAEAMSES